MNRRFFDVDVLALGASQERDRLVVKRLAQAVREVAKVLPEGGARVSPSVPNISPCSPFSLRAWYMAVELLLAGRKRSRMDGGVGSSMPAASIRCVTSSTSSEEVMPGCCAFRGRGAGLGSCSSHLS